MATYGFIDWDLFSQASSSVFNLELMKRSTYLKSKGHFVKLLTTIDPREFEKYTHIYIFKNVEDNNYPKVVFNHPRVVVYGDVVQNGITSLTPEERAANPDMYIYLQAEKFFSRREEDKLRFKRLSNAIHVQMSYDGINLEPGWDKEVLAADRSKRDIVVHDAHPENISGALEALTELSGLNMKGRVSDKIFRFVNPFHCTTPEMALGWRRLSKWGYNQLYYFDFLPTQKFLTRFVKESIRFKWKGDRTRGENSTIHIQYNRDQTMKDIVNHIQTIYPVSVFGYYWRMKTIFQVPDLPDYPNDWVDFIRRLNDFFTYGNDSNTIKLFTPFTSFITNHYGKEEIRPIKDVMSVLKEETPKLYTLLKEAAYVLFIEDNGYLFYLNYIDYLQEVAEYDTRQFNIIKHFTTSSRDSRGRV